MTKGWVSSREGYDEALAGGLRSAALLLAVLFVGYAVWHPFALEGAAGPVMGAVAGTTAAALLGTALHLGSRPVRAGHAHRIGALLAAAVFGNCALQYAFTEQVYLSVNATLVLVGIGICLVDPRWVAGLVAGACATWLAVVGVVTSAEAALAAAPNLALGAVMAALANTVRVGTLRRLLDTQAELRALSQRDELTGLLNRRGFLEAAQQRLDRGRPIRVWFVDVDGLKAVNDAHGHDVGDVLLMSVGTALAEVFSGAVVARLSGDEFAVVEDHGSAGGAVQARAALDARLRVAAQATGLPVSVSTGTSGSWPGATLSDVLSSADAAMYAAKGQGSGRTIRLPAPRTAPPDAHEAAARSDRSS